jgi:hypothetical protein
VERLNDCTTLQAFWILSRLDAFGLETKEQQKKNFIYLDMAGFKGGSNDMKDDGRSHQVGGRR